MCGRCGQGDCRDEAPWCDVADDEGWDDDDERYCSGCGGDGERECNDPLQCMNTHDRFNYCRCGYCGGSGLAKDQTIW